MTDTIAQTLETAIAQARATSADLWDVTIESATGDLSDWREARDLTDEAYDAALDALAEGDLVECQEALESAASEERVGGDDDCAQRAIDAVRKYRQQLLDAAVTIDWARGVEIVSGEGTGEGTVERYDGEQTVAALRERLTSARGGYRWAFARPVGATMHEERIEIEVVS
jgi:hypothetical protein